VKLPAQPKWWAVSEWPQMPLIQKLHWRRYIDMFCKFPGYFLSMGLWFAFLWITRIVRHGLYELAHFITTYFRWKFFLSFLLFNQIRTIAVVQVVVILWNTFLLFDETLFFKDLKPLFTLLCLKFISDIFTYLKEFPKSFSKLFSKGELEEHCLFNNTLILLI